MTNSSRYLAYMLRLWQVDRQGRPEWRASLESPHTAERLGFADVAQLLAFLQEKTGAEFNDDENENSE
jgi:hypothetical protein